MIGMWICRWMAFGTAVFIISGIIRCIIVYKMFTTKGKADEVFKKDEHTKRNIQLAYGGGLVQYIVYLVPDILLWPLSVPIRIYHTLRIRDEYLK